MSTRCVLWATDFSESSKQALTWAEALAHHVGAQLVMLHVEPGQPTTEFGAIYKGLPDPDIAEVAHNLAQILPSKPGLNYEHRIRAGDPIEQILAEAHERDAVAIVLGSHGRTGVRRMLLGSVADGVLRKALCPVMICKMPPTDDSDEDFTATTN